MKVNESFAVEATPEVRKDQRFEWYVNWLKSLENKQWWSEYDDDNIYLGIFTTVVGNWYEDGMKDKILTLDEVYSRYGKEIYEANGIEQPFQGSREYDEKLLDEFSSWCWKNNELLLGAMDVSDFLNNRYSNESILKQIAEHKSKIEELKKQLK